MIHEMIAESVLCLGKEPGRVTNNEEILWRLLLPSKTVKCSVTEGDITPQNKK